MEWVGWRVDRRAGSQRHRRVTLGDVNPAWTRRDRFATRAADTPSAPHATKPGSPHAPHATPSGGPSDLMPGGPPGRAQPGSAGPGTRAPRARAPVEAARGGRAPRARDPARGNDPVCPYGRVPGSRCRPGPAGRVAIRTGPARYTPGPVLVPARARPCPPVPARAWTNRGAPRTRSAYGRRHADPTAAHAHPAAGLAHRAAGLAPEPAPHAPDGASSGPTAARARGGRCRQPRRPPALRTASRNRPASVAPDSGRTARSPMVRR